MSESKQGDSEFIETLGKPVFIAFSSDTLRVRRNMLITAAAVLAYIFSGASIDTSQVTLLGLKFKGVSQSSLEWGLFALLLYHFIHFLWQSCDAWQEWRIRLSGSFNTKKETAIYGGAVVDTNENMRQRSINSFWQENGEIICRFPEAIKELTELSHPLKEALSNSEDQQLKKLLREVSNKLSKTATPIKNMEQVRELLQRFDTSWRGFQRSQVLRFAIMEWGVPVVLALWGLVCLIWPLVLGR